MTLFLVVFTVLGWVINGAIFFILIRRARRAERIAAVVAQDKIDSINERLRDYYRPSQYAVWDRGPVICASTAAQHDIVKGRAW